MTATPRDDLAAFVDPFIGTDGSANCFVPSVRVPGMRIKDAWIARTTLVSDLEREVVFTGAVDWWAKLLVNGEPVKTDAPGNAGTSFFKNSPKHSGTATLR